MALHKTASSRDALVLVDRYPLLLAIMIVSCNNMVWPHPEYLMYLINNRQELCRHVFHEVPIFFPLTPAVKTILAGFIGRAMIYLWTVRYRTMRRCTLYGVLVRV